jgi:uncharacterized protein (TIGR02246 family)
MSRHLVLAAMFISGGFLSWLATAGRLSPDVQAQDKPAPASKEQEQPVPPEMAAVRQTAEAFTKAFNAGDAKAVAAFWTKDGEFIGATGERLRGRDEIEKGYVGFFKQHPKAQVEVEPESVRLLSQQTALEEGALRLRLPGDKEVSVSRYSALHVREADGWKLASVSEWVPDAQQLVSLKDVEWLLGTWTAKGPEAELRITYTWDEDKAFLRGRFVLTKGDRVINAGTQVIGKNPAGGLRSWVFDKNGTFGDSVWTREENRWVIEAAGTLPDGSETKAVNILIPLDKDTFTWQSLERTAAGSALPAMPPVRVTRVKADR